MSIHAVFRGCIKMWGKVGGVAQNVLTPPLLLYFSSLFSGDRGTVLCLLSVSGLFPAQNDQDRGRDEADPGDARRSIRQLKALMRHKYIGHADR